ncbi:MAG TPA: DNA polymerase III subunit gamma/tau, partial [Phycisphaerae bacterium]|nr:DNA polymerase III subunit gamma/tau [Phycisphaerae bacterium]
MAEYLVLARKYRSTTFDEVVGQEPIARTLVNAITGGRIAHAYLFTGTRGVGKTTMARLFAKALNCLKSDAPTPTPCNRCDACVAISRGDDVDVVEIDGASNRGIDEIRELRANAIYRPARSRYKIYYIDEVHMLTKEAFNALLKTLEEPPGHVKFIFATTEAEKLPATILSRCQRFDFRNIPTRRIAEHLRAICKTEKVQVDDDALFRVARSAAGSMRDALSLLDQLLAAGEGTVRDEDVVRLLGVPGDERVLSIASAVAAGDPAGALKGLDDALASGVTLGTAVGALGETFRNLMVASACGSGSELIELPDAHRAAVVELAGRFS